MNRKFSGRGDSSEDQCAVYRNSDPKTFLNFVDKAIDEFPGGVSTKNYSVSCRNDNNPYEVLKNKGLINISRDAVTTGDCSPDVKLNFYSEHSRDGHVTKVFQSNHQFKYGKLVYSATHELLPDLPPRLERSARCEAKGRNELSACKDDLKTNSNVICSEATKKKLIEIFRDIEKRRITQYYKKAAEEKHHRFSKSLPPKDLHKSRDDENQQKKMRATRLENTRRKAQPFTMPPSRKTSPNQVRYHVIYKPSPSPKYSKMSSSHESSSSEEISVSSRESYIYSSPERTTVKTSKRQENYRRTFSLSPSHSRPRLRRDLFVIPEHTCRKVPIRSRKVTIPPEVPRHTPRKSHTAEIAHTPRKSQWDAVRRYVSSPEFKYRVYNNRTARSSPKGKDFEKSTTREQPRPFAGPKGILRGKETATHHRIRFTEEDTTNGDKARRSRFHEEYKADLYNAQDRGEEVNQYRRRSDKQWDDSEACGSKNRPLKHGMREETYVEMPFAQAGAESDESTSSTEEESTQSESDSSDRTLPFTPAIDPEYERENRKNTYDREGWAKRSRDARTRGREIEREQQPIDKKLTKKIRQIHPNKVVHIDETGKRVSQYFVDGNATLDSEKAFEEEDRGPSKKITIFGCSPKSAGCHKIYLMNDREPYEVTFTEESFEHYLRRVMGVDHRGRMDAMKNTVNDKFMKSMVNDKVRKSIMNDEIMQNAVNYKFMKSIVNDKVMRNMMNDKVLQGIVNDKVMQNIVNDKIMQNAVNDKVMKNLVNDRVTQNIVNDKALTEYRRKYETYYSTSPNRGRPAGKAVEKKEYRHKLEANNKKQDCEACVIERLLAD